MLISIHERERVASSKFFEYSDCRCYGVQVYNLCSIFLRKFINCFKSNQPNTSHIQQLF